MVLMAVMGRARIPGNIVSAVLLRSPYPALVRPLRAIKWLLLGVWWQSMFLGFVDLPIGQLLTYLISITVGVMGVVCMEGCLARWPGG